ncbi:hypothetical protein Nmel_003733, partial [Mimus melanotis]
MGMCAFQRHHALGRGTLQIHTAQVDLPAHLQICAHLLHCPCTGIQLYLSDSSRTKVKELINRDAIRVSHDPHSVSYGVVLYDPKPYLQQLREPTFRPLGAGWPKSGLSLEHLAFSLHPDAYPSVIFKIKYRPERR